MNVQIARVYYPVKTLGPGNRMGIWFTGCNKKCKECISPEMQDKNYGKLVDVDELVKVIERKKYSIEGFTVSGGEPFDQFEALGYLLQHLSYISDDVIIFTGYTYKELIEKYGSDLEKVLNYVSLIVDGPYIKELNEKQGLRGSSNQNFIILNKKYNEQDLTHYKRKIQNFYYDDKFVEIGIP